jgi:hypothetical protein
MAVSGGSIAIICTLSKQCETSISDNVFQNNIATLKGGSIYYDMNRPSMNNNVFTNDTAPYGPNIASYAVKIYYEDSNTVKQTLTDVGSGLSYATGTKFELRVVDLDDQVMNLLSEDTIKISPVSVNASVTSIDYIRLSSGEAKFEAVTLSSQVGVSNIKYTMTSKAIDYVIINTILKNSSNEDEFDNEFTVNFRYCKPGEIETSEKQCRLCNYGTYTLEWNQTTCNN